MSIACPKSLHPSYMLLCVHRVLTFVLRMRVWLTCDDGVHANRAVCTVQCCTTALIMQVYCSVSEADVQFFLSSRHLVPFSFLIMLKSGYYSLKRALMSFSQHPPTPRLSFLEPHELFSRPHGFSFSFLVLNHHRLRISSQFLMTSFNESIKSPTS